ncbi:unnamed protein product [Effrenium voratum]|nr:unnamed protein product [Effrenium voratum]
MNPDLDYPPIRSVADLIAFAQTWNVSEEVIEARKKRMTELLSSGAFLHAEHGDEAGGMQKLRKELENETAGHPWLGGTAAAAAVPHLAAMAVGRSSGAPWSSKCPSTAPSLVSPTSRRNRLASREIASPVESGRRGHPKRDVNHWLLCGEIMESGKQKATELPQLRPAAHCTRLRLKAGSSEVTGWRRIEHKDQLALCLFEPEADSKRSGGWGFADLLGLREVRCGFLLQKQGPSSCELLWLVKLARSGFMLKSALSSICPGPLRQLARGLSKPMPAQAEATDTKTDAGSGSETEDSDPSDSEPKEVGCEELSNPQSQSPPSHVSSPNDEPTPELDEAAPCFTAPMEFKGRSKVSQWLRRRRKWKARTLPATPIAHNSDADAHSDADVEPAVQKVENQRGITARAIPCFKRPQRGLAFAAFPSPPGSTTPASPSRKMRKRRAKQPEVTAEAAAAIAGLADWLLELQGSIDRIDLAAFFGHRAPALADPGPASSALAKTRPR